MKTTVSVPVATWLLEHLTFGNHRESLSGDLMEELRSGRSAGWYRRQVVAAIVTGVWTALRAWIPALVFSAGWSMLYPAWRTISLRWIPHAVPEQWLALSWPWTTVLELACGIVPAITFIWIGFLVFLVFRKDVIAQLSPLRLIGSLSASLNVLLLATLALVHHLKHPEPGLLCVTRENFYLVVHLYNVSVPLAMSIFVAICRVLPHAHKPPRKRRLARAWIDRLTLAKTRAHERISAPEELASQPPEVAKLAPNTFLPA